MKILSLLAENVKGIKVVQITPDGNLVQITGPNGSGKTSVLDSIYWALAGTSNIPAKPVRTGEHRAIVKLDLGEFTVTRRFTDAGGTSLLVEGDGKEFKSPQGVLDKLLGSLTFDPLAFSRMSPKQQLEQLKGMVKLEVDVDLLDTQNLRDFAERTEVNRTVKSLNERTATLFARMNPSLPKEPIDTDALLAQLEGAADFNASIERERHSRAARLAEVERMRSSATGKRQQAEELLLAANLLEETAQREVESLNALQPLSELRNTSAIRDEFDKARAINVGIAANNDYLVAKATEEAARKAAQALTDRMEDRNRAKAAAIAAAKMPVEGLSFGDGMVLYNGLPFEQASSAEQLRVSVAIAMAGNPKLRVLRIQDGSLLDEKSLALIAAMAAENDMQVWIEQVDTSGMVGIFMQEGEVAKVNKPQFPFTPDIQFDEERMAAVGAANESRGAAVNL